LSSSLAMILLIIRCGVRPERRDTREFCRGFPAINRPQVQAREEPVAEEQERAA